jgi:hypothetical protein
MRRADLWEAGTDQRELLADERERLADEREALANEREVLADRHDDVLDRRENDERTSGDNEVAQTQAALYRAEAAVRRAEAQLERVRQAAARVRAGVARHTAASDRVTAAQHADATLDPDDRAWLADRRDFVSAGRDDQADERDGLADERDEAAGQRELLADGRERESLQRERHIDQQRRADRQTASAARVPDDEERRAHAELRASSIRQREAAAASRRTATRDRARAAAEWGPQAYGPMLVASFAQFARQLFSSEDLNDVLPQVLKFTVDAVAGCDAASITLSRNGQVVGQMASNAIAAELDDIQFGTGIGPALDAMGSENPVRVRDLAGSRRWPVLAATATQLGVASALCHGLFVHRPAQWSALGTLTLYSATADAFSDEDQEFGTILAAYVSVAVATAHRRDEVDRREAALHRGLSTRDVIGQAKGILMERQRLSAGEAFDLLRRTSQRLNRKLSDVAQQLADTGEMPT